MELGECEICGQLTPYKRCSECIGIKLDEDGMVRGHHRIQAVSYFEELAEPLKPETKEKFMKKKVDKTLTT